MFRKRRWEDLSEGQRRLVVIGGVIEGILKVLALIDLKRRPASEVRGPKWLWATSITLISSAGALPISYFVFGRKRQPLPAEPA